MACFRQKQQEQGQAVFLQGSANPQELTEGGGAQDKSWGARFLVSEYKLACQGWETSHAIPLQNNTAN